MHYVIYNERLKSGCSEFGLSEKCSIPKTVRILALSEIQMQWGDKHVYVYVLASFVEHNN